MVRSTLTLTAAVLALTTVPAAAQPSDAELRALVSPLLSDLRADTGLLVETADGDFEEREESGEPPHPPDPSDHGPARSRDAS